MYPSISITFAFCLPLFWCRCRLVVERKRGKADRDVVNKDLSTDSLLSITIFVSYDVNAAL